MFVVSDVHLEFYPKNLWGHIIDSFPQEDIIVIAGDFATKDILPSVVPILLSKYKHIVYVAGNHEYYHSSFEETDAILSELDKLPNFHWLNGTDTIINGEHFVGGTLWFRQDPLDFWAKRQLNDFRLIKRFEDHVYDRNETIRASLEALVTLNSVVVTHHMPSPSCLHPRFERSELNRFYVCNMEEMIARKQPKIWISGHGHDVYDFMIGKTRLVNNAFGYPNENSGFRDFIC